MLPPIRPSPTMPISTPLSLPSPLRGEGTPYCCSECFPTGRRVAAQRHPQHGQLARAEGLEVAQRLRLLEDREGERLAGDRHVARILLHDLQEKTRLRAAFVELPRRVEEPRPVTGRRRDLGAVAHRRADG